MRTLPTVLRWNCLTVVASMITIIFMNQWRPYQAIVYNFSTLLANFYENFTLEPTVSFDTPAPSYHTDFVPSDQVPEHSTECRDVMTHPTYKDLLLMPEDVFITPGFEELDTQEFWKPHVTNPKFYQEMTTVKYPEGHKDEDFATMTYVNIVYLDMTTKGPPFSLQYREDGDVVTTSTWSPIRRIIEITGRSKGERKRPKTTTTTSTSTMATKTTARYKQVLSTWGLLNLTWEEANGLHTVNPYKNLYNFEYPVIPDPPDMPTNLSFVTVDLDHYYSDSKHRPRTTGRFRKIVRKFRDKLRKKLKETMDNYFENVTAAEP